MLSGGQLTEILKVLRRRFLNFLKFIRRCIGVVYDQPVLLRQRQRKLTRKVLAAYYSYPAESKNEAAIKVALIIRDGTTHPKSSAFIRLIGPLSHPDIANKVWFKIYPENTTQLDEAFSVCIVQRTAFDDQASAQELVTNLKATGVSLVVDTDDAFHSTDSNHPEHQDLNSKSQALDYLLRSAGQVWVSTEQLKTHLPKTQQPALVMENCLDPRVWKADTSSIKVPGSNRLELLYMGTATHDADLAMILPGLDKLAEKYPNQFRLTVMGVATDMPDRPWIEKLSQRRHQSIYPGFVSWFLHQGPFDIGLSPLMDSEFNRDKSDIKCLDYLAAGITPVVSDVEAYNSPAINDYIIKVPNTPDQWFQKLSEQLDDLQAKRINHQKTLAESHKYLWSQRSSQIVGAKMLAQLQSLKKTT
jgi:hypothetical protein